MPRAMEPAAEVDMYYYDYAFEARIERLAIGNTSKVLHYSVVILPEQCRDELPFDKYPKLRIIGEVGDHPVRGAWNPVADGRKYFILSAKFLSTAGLSVGDATEMRFNIDDQDFVDVPDELADALAADRALDTSWNRLTPGKKRFHCHQIASAKRQATRDRRLQAVLAEIRG